MGGAGGCIAFWSHDRGCDLVFREGVPKWEELEPQIRRWLDEGLDLEAIREGVFEHIMLYLEDADEAMNMAFDVVTGLIEGLPATPENLERLLAYIATYHDRMAYDRLLSDFLPLLTEEQMEDILGEARTIFIPEVTREWERNAQKELRRRRRT